MEEQQYNLFVEIIKYHSVFFRHLTTLSTGSILVIIALIERVFNNPKGFLFVGCSIIALLVSLMASLSMILTLGVFLGNYYKSKTASIEEKASPEFCSKLVKSWDESANRANKLQKLSLWALWFGIGFLAIFFARNIAQYGLGAFF